MILQLTNRTPNSHLSWLIFWSIRALEIIFIIWLLSLSLSREVLCAFFYAAFSMWMLVLMCVTDSLTVFVYWTVFFWCFVCSYASVVIFFIFFEGWGGVRIQEGLPLSYSSLILLEWRVWRIWISRRAELDLLECMHWCSKFL